ncbi:MAG: TatD family hydrolase [Candidatus Hinthialibacter antarcticus]|nr:TatD family hydrolase [Candidatus Hinthialibacter antarcticus]
MPLFDSHLHLNSPQFDGRVDETWAEAQQADVTRAVVIGYDLETSKKAIEIAEQHKYLYAAVGVSPHDICKTPKGYIDQIRDFAAHEKVVAIGEAGLEYHYPVGPKEEQIEGFKQQIQLANELNKPIVIHLRDADDDFIQIMNEEPPNSAILHCFTATMRLMEAAVDKGYFVSFSGIVTFKKAVEIQQAAAAVPNESLLIETDAPYLAPTPHRGKQCEPKMVIHTAEKIAQLRHKTLEDISELTYQNACKVFCL